MASWIDSAFATLDVGDARLNARAKLILEARSANPGASIPGACASEAEREATYRLLANPKVTPQLILDAFLVSTIARAAAFDAIVVAQDTTELDFTRFEERVGGPLVGPSRRGLLAHVLCAFSSEGLPLGLLGADIWGRPEASKKRPTRSALTARPIEKKESFRWLAGYRSVCAFKARLPKGKLVVAVSDSEGDIYECLVAAQDHRQGDQAAWANYVIRACQNRKVADESDFLFQAVQSTPVLGTYSLNVRARPTPAIDDRKRKQPRAPRVAKLEIRAAEIRLAPPGKKEKLPHVVTNAVLVSEANPPEGEVPITWLLLTDLPIATPQHLEAVIKFYIGRWGIEVYFKVLKSGCAVEELQLETDKSLETCIAMYMIIAWRILYLTMLGRACPDLPCTVAFAPSEWQAAFAAIRKKPLPVAAPTMKEMLLMVAQLGGFMGAKGAMPGVKAVWTGLQRLEAIAFGWDLARGGGARPG